MSSILVATPILPSHRVNGVNPESTRGHKQGNVLNSNDSNAVISEKTCFSFSSLNLNLASSPLLAART